MEGKVCSICKQWKLIEEYYKNKGSKDGRQSKCKDCEREYKKQYYKDNKEYFKEYKRQYRKDNVEHCKQYYKQYYKDNKEKIKEYDKQYYKDNVERRKEYGKQYSKQYHKDNVENNLQYISNIVDQIRPIFKELNLPIYGYIYKFENIKTGRVYIGQTIQPLNRRYEGGIINGWIKDRKSKVKQKFLEELIEEDFVLTEVLDVAFCQYHLNVLETYYINKYDSCENGYNNTIGNHKTDDGLEEFIEILQQHNLEFVDGQILKKAN